MLVSEAASFLLPPIFGVLDNLHRQVVLHAVRHQHQSWAVSHSQISKNISEKIKTRRVSSVNDLATLNEQLILTLLISYAYIES